MYPEHFIAVAIGAVAFPLALRADAMGNKLTRTATESIKWRGTVMLSIFHVNVLGSSVSNYKVLQSFVGAWFLPVHELTCGPRI